MAMELLITNPRTNLHKLICLSKLTKKEIEKTVKFYRNAKYLVQVV